MCFIAALPALAAPAQAAGRSSSTGSTCTTLREPGLVVLNAGCSKPVVIYAHAAGETTSGLLRMDLLAGLAAEGYSVVASDLCGPLNWGSPCAVSEMHNLVRRFAPGKRVQVVAMSMGGAALINYLAAFPDGISSAVGIVPVSTWETDWLRRATGATLPPLGSRITIPYRILAAQADEIVGPPITRGPRVSVKSFPGGHDLWQRISVADVLKALKK